MTFRKILAGAGLLGAVFGASWVFAFAGIGVTTVFYFREQWEAKSYLKGIKDCVEVPDLCKRVYKLLPPEIKP